MNLKILTNIINEYLYKSNIFLDEQNFILHLHSNPNFPTLKAISDTFDYFNIQNITAAVPKELLDKLPECFLAVILNHNVEEVVMVLKKKKGIRIDGQFIEKTLSKKDFLIIWTGTIIAVEEKRKEKIILTSKKLVYLIVLIILLLCLQIALSDIILTCLSILGLTGTFISLLIVSQEAGYKNNIVKRVCNSVNSKGGCDKVINSNSKIFGFISLSNAATAYFVSDLLILNLLNVNFSFLYSTSLLGLPVILYSLYSQVFRLKQWCVLCLGISALYIGKLIIYTYLFYGAQSTFNAVYFLKAFMIMLLAYISIDYLKTVFSENSKLKNEQLELFRLKKDLKIFSALLDANRIIDNSTLRKPGSITFGGDNAVLIIDAVTNPTCGFCTESFKVYYKLLQADHKNIKVNFIFNVPFENPDNIATKIAVKAMTLYFDGYETEALEMLNNWYMNRDKDTWLSTYEQSTDITMRINQVLISHRNWMAINDIQYTPATIINGRVFPNNYQVEDLLLLANDFILEEEKKKTLVMADA